MPNCAQLQQHVLSWIQICLWGQYLCISPTRIQRTQSEVVADKRLICSSALSAINASSRFVIHFPVRVTFLPRVLTDGSTFFSIFSCTFCSTFFSSVLRECFFTHFFQYFFEYFSEYSPARVLFLVLFRVLFWVISCESTFWSIFFSFLSLLSVQLLLPRDHRKHIQMRRSSLKSCYSSSMSEALLNGEKNDTRNITHFLFQALKNRFMNVIWM